VPVQVPSPKSRVQRNGRPISSALPPPTPWCQNGRRRNRLSARSTSRRFPTPRCKDCLHHNHACPWITSAPCCSPCGRLPARAHLPRRFNEPRFQIMFVAPVSFYAHCLVSWHNSPLLEAVPLSIVSHVPNIVFLRLTGPTETIFCFEISNITRCVIRPVRAWRP
jgi:hypothetical protein